MYPIMYTYTLPGHEMLSWDSKRQERVMRSMLHLVYSETFYQMRRTLMLVMVMNLKIELLLDIIYYIYSHYEIELNSLFICRRSCRFTYFFSRSCNLHQSRGFLFEEIHYKIDYSIGTRKQWHHRFYCCCFSFEIQHPSLQRWAYPEFCSLLNPLYLEYLFIQNIKNVFKF